jgi:phytoene desaturase
VVPVRFSLYLHTPTRTDDSWRRRAAKACTSWRRWPLRSGHDWRELAEPFAQRILDHLEHRFGLEGLQANIAVKKLFTPEDFQRKQNAVYGSAWGVEPKLTRPQSFRPHNRSEDVKGLYLVGASTHRAPVCPASS